MPEQTSSPQTAHMLHATDPTGYLQREYETWKTLFNAQPAVAQRFLEAQGRRLAEALTRAPGLTQAHFTLPDFVFTEAAASAGGQPEAVPPEAREQLAGGLADRLIRTDLNKIVHQRLMELEHAPERAVAVSAGLIRYATATQMVHALLPSGRSVTYIAAEGEAIPTLPVTNGLEPQSAITATTDAIAEEDGRDEAGRGELLVPYVPAARKFYLPQWVAFDKAGRLLVNSTDEAEAHVASMQRFMTVLHAAFALAPYMVADEDYQRKRYGLLGQLVNQARALALYETGEIIRTIQRRAAAQDLNRGLSLNLPYFDDQALEMKMHAFEVIPAGRIMFVQAFVVRAAREEQVKVAQDTRLSPSTRKHLLSELRMLEEAFEK